MFVSTAAACRFPSLCMSCFWRSWKRQYCCILDFHPQTFKTQYKTTLCCVAGKNSSVQSPPKYRLKNIAWLLTVFVISLYSDYFRDVDICQCSEYKQSDIIYLSSETQRQKSLENTRITGNGAKIFAKAKTLAAREDYSTAQKLYQQLIQEAPNFAPAYSNLANIEVIFGNYSEAVNNYTRAIELAPLSDDTWIVYLNRANTWIALGNNAKAMADVQQAAQGRPKDPLILSTRALLLSYEGKWDEAFEQYQNAVNSRPDQVQPFWFNYGMLLFERGKPFEARSIIYRVAQKYPKQSDIHIVLAGIEYSQGHVSTAKSQWKLVEDPKRYTPSLVETEKRWPPKVKAAVESLIQVSSFQ